MATTTPTTALFIIDIQHMLATNPSTRIPNADGVLAAADKVVSAARRLVASHRARGEPAPLRLVFVQHEEDDADGLVRGAEAWELCLPPREDGEMLVAKTTRNTFETNPGLAAALREQGVSEIVACGIQSECCVLETCKGGLAAGFGVTLLRGAHGTYDAGGKSAGEIGAEVEGELREKGVRVVGWEGVVDAWEEMSRKA